MLLLLKGCRWFTSLQFQIRETAGPFATTVK